MSQLLFKLLTFSKRDLKSITRFLLACCVFAAGLNSSVLAAEPATEARATIESSEKLTAIQLTAILKENEQKSGSKASRVLGSGPRVTIMAQPSSSSESDREMKIDAVFFAKTLIESAPRQIEKVDVIFSGARPDDSKVISIDKKAIQTYGEGNITPEDFLRTLHLLPVNAEETPSLEPGPLLERRLLVNERIEKLRKTGTGVKPFQTIFQSIESAIKGGDTTNLSSKIEDLEEKLSEQEEQVAIAKRTARGHGLTPVPGKSTAGTSPAPSQSPVLDDKAFERKREMFIEKAATIIQHNQGTTGGQKLADLKRRIDERLAKGQNGEARPLIDEFIKVEGEVRAQNLNRRQDFSGNKFDNLNRFNSKNRGGQW